MRGSLWYHLRMLLGKESSDADDADEEDDRSLLQGQVIKGYDGSEGSTALISC